MLKRMNAFGQLVTCMPRFRFADDDGKSGGKTDKKGTKPEDDKSKVEEPKDRGYPANTPVKDMTLEQQKAYHEFHAGKHENRVKALSDAFGGDLTPEALAAVIKERDDLRTKSLSEGEQAVEKAREEGRAEYRAVLATERVRAAFEKALVGRMPDASALLDVDRTKFVKGDGADVEAIATWVEENSTEATSSSGKKQVDLGQGKRGTNAPEKGVGAGKDLYTSRKKPTKSE